MRTLTWQAGQHRIPFRIGRDCAEAVAGELAALDADVLFIVADAAVWRLHGDRYEAVLRRHALVRVIPWEGGEIDKSLGSVEEIIRQALAGGATRRSVLVALGGGVVGNLTGLAAALLFRGIRFVHLPTTLLAMHDSVTSLKQGVNCADVKNIAGAFYPPAAIFVDLRFLDTLPPDQVRAGLAELVKDALVLGGQCAETLADCLGRPGPFGPTQWERLIELGVAAKARLMRDDPYECGPAMIFEYGHTVGHALELTYGGQFSHGNCVAWGARCAAWIARDLGYMTADAMERHDRLFGLLGPLPRPAQPRPTEEVQRRIERDNKRGYLPGARDGEVAMVLLHEPGRVVQGPAGIPLVLVPGPAIDRSLEWIGRLWH